MKQVFNNLLECVGHTPIIRLNRIGSDLPHTFYVKMEPFNPGNSIKDRIAIQMVDDAERAGLLKPGGTIIECTSGNTGMGLALVAAVRGYQCIFVMPDKVSSEKIKALRAFGAKVITTPTAVEPEDPRSYYSVAKRLAQETPQSFYSNQYHNPSNPLAHYRMTGPEIWDQLGDKVDYLVAGAGTGGTLCGTAKFLKEKKPSIRSVAVDPEGSIFYDYFKTGEIKKVVTTYKVEGFGEDFLPGTIDFSLIDEMVQVNDRECFLTARELVRKEGIFAGGSSGGAVAAALKLARTLKEPKTFLIIIPDGGTRYLSKQYDDDWMRDNSFLTPDSAAGTVRDVLGDRVGKVVSTDPKAKVADVVKLMKDKSISQLPVLRQGKLVGLITEVDLLGAMLSGKASAEQGIEPFVDQDFARVKLEDPLSVVADAAKQGAIAVVLDRDAVVGIVTKIDLVEHLSKRLS